MAAQSNAFKSPFRYNSDSSLQPADFIYSHFKTNGIRMDAGNFFIKNARNLLKIGLVVTVFQIIITTVYLMLK